MAVKSGLTLPVILPPSRRMSDAVRDALRRPLASLRLSVTDRCNLRCRYCMPEDEYVWLPRTSILTFEEIERLTSVFTGLGAQKVRLTGGEPLLRHDLPTLVAKIARNPRVNDLALTTNGLLLAKQAAALRAAGLQRVTVSLDTLRPERMLVFAKSARHADVLEGIAAAQQAGFDRLKLNQVVSQREMLDVLARRYGAIEPVHATGDDDRAPAERFRLADGTTFGIIASVTAPFCRTC